MPAVITWILSGLLSIAGTVAGRVMIALGFGFVEYVGISAMIDSVMTRINGDFGGAFGSMPLMAAWAGFFQLDVHVSLVASAIGVRLLLSGLSGGTVRRLVQK